MRAPSYGDGDLERTTSEEDEPPAAPVAGRPKRGTVLAGKYRLEMLLGEGGMASVWSAYHLELELPVAIKLLRSGAKSSRLVERLRLEARAGAHLVHPSTVRVFDIATTDAGEPFIVMELLTGESLARALARGRMSSVRAVQVMLPIAEALGLAHAHGIVHRDLKPDNVFLSDDDGQVQPKLLDFGIAKATRRGVAVRLTERGTVLGSPYYMSPEQVRGEEVDFRSDIWSFCVVLYRAVVGRSPFPGPDRRAVMDAIAGDEPARVPVEASVDERLARLLCWGLAKDPERRPPSIRELGRMLALWLLTQGVSEDASGAPVSAKWLAHAAEPGGHGAGVVGTPEPAPSQRERSLGPTVPLEALTGGLAARTLERLAPTRTRRWAMLAGASLLIVSASLAGTDSRQARPPVASAVGAPALAAPAQPTISALEAVPPPTTLTAAALSGPPSPQLEAPSAQPSIARPAVLAPAKPRPRKTPPPSPSRQLPF